MERTIPDAGDAVGNGNGGEAGAVIERKGSDAGDTVGDGNRNKTGTIAERVISDDLNTVGDRIFRFGQHRRIGDQLFIAFTKQHAVHGGQIGMIQGNRYSAFLACVLMSVFAIKDEGVLSY